MKAYKVITIITIILAILVITTVSIFGIYTRKEYKMVDIVKKYKFGMDFAESVVMNFDLDTSVKEKEVYDKDGNLVEQEEGKEYKEEDGYTTVEILANPLEVLTVGNHEKSKNILIDRLRKARATQYSVRQNKDTGRIAVEIPDNTSLETLMGILSPRGKFEIIDEETKEVLMGNGDIGSVTIASAQPQANQMAIYLQIQFNKEGTRKLSEISEKYKTIETVEETGTENEVAEGETEEPETETQKQVSILLDGETYKTTHFEGKMTDGLLNIHIGTATTDEEIQDYRIEAETIAFVLNTGEIPLAYTITSEGLVSTLDQTNLIIAGGIACGLMLAILIFFVIKFRLKGIYGFILGIGYISILSLIIRIVNTTLTMEGMMGLVISAIINYAFIYMVLDEMKKDGVRSKEALKNNIIKFFIRLVPVYIVSVILIFAGDLKAISPGVTLFWGAVLMYIYNFVFTKILLSVVEKGAK